MSVSLTLSRLSYHAALISLIASIATVAVAQVTAPSVYTTSIMVQGEPEGTEFADWASSGITVVDADPADNPGFLDIANIQIANDSDFIYIHASLHNTEPTSLLNIFLAFDTDQNPATGFDVLQIGELGSEVGYQNDFPFAQYAGVFNLNLSFTGGPVNNGGALIYPFWTDAGPPSGVQIEWAVPLDAIIQYPVGLGGPAPAFPNQSFDFVVYTDQGLADITQVISYTLATDPNPGTPGDFNSDGNVDGVDFLIWQRGGSPTTLSAADLQDWQNSYGAGSLAAVTALPEPGSMVIAAAGMIIALAMRRRDAWK
jgi:hypothetical protein